jgi:hypothetical protein
LSYLVHVRHEILQLLQPLANPRSPLPLSDAPRVRRAAALCPGPAGDGVWLELQEVIHAGHLQRRLLRQAKLGVDVAEAGDHVVAVVAGGGGGDAGLLAAARGREHDGVGVVPGAHGEVPGGEEGGGLRAVAGAIAGAVAAAAGDDALPDVGDEAAHLRYLRQVLPREAPLRAQPPVRHRAGVAAAAGVAAHPSRRGHAIACNSSQAARQFLQQILLSVSGHN